MATVSQKSASPSTSPSTSTGEFSRGKTIFVLAVVIGCFAILWPKIFYPMLTASLGAGDDEQQCCNVISEEDADFHNVIAELCAVIKKRDAEGTLKKDPIVIKEPPVNININVNISVNANGTEIPSNSSTSTNQSTPVPPQPQKLAQPQKKQQQLQQKPTDVPKGYNKYRKFYVGPGALCRNEVLRTCGIDILVLVKDENDKDSLVITKDYVETLNKIRGYNASTCIKEEYGIHIGYHRRFKTAGSSTPSHMRPERPIHFHRPELMHPALREKGNAIPPSSFSAPVPQRTLEKEARPGPFPGVRPPVGGAGYQAAPPKGGGTMGIIMPIYTIAIVVFFVYTIMKILFRKNEDKPPIQPMIKDYGMDPAHRKFVFSEEYAPGAERSMKDSYNKEDRDAGIRRRSSTGKKFQEQQKSRLDENSPESEQSEQQESKPAETNQENEEHIELHSSLKPVQTEAVMSVEQKFPEEVKLEKVYVKEKRPSISSSSSSVPEPNRTESKPVELYSKLNPVQTEVSLSIDEKFPQNVKLEKVHVKEKRPSISTESPSEKIELYSDLKPMQTEKAMAVDEKYPQNIALEKIQVSQKDLTPTQLKRLSISEPPKVDQQQQQQQKETDKEQQQESQSKPLEAELKGSLMEDTDTATDLTEVTDLIESSSQLDLDSGTSSDLTMIQDDTEYGDGEDPELASLAIHSSMSNKYDEDLDLLTSSVDLPSLSLAGSSTTDTDRLIDISLMDKLNLDDLNLKLSVIDSGMRDRDAIVTALRGIIEATLEAADKHQQTQEKIETKDSNSNTTTTKTKGGEQQTDKNKTTKTKNNNDNSITENEEELTNLHTTRLNNTDHNGYDNDYDYDNNTHIHNTTTPTTNSTSKTNSTITTPAKSILKNKHNSHTKQSKLKTQLEFAHSEYENDYDYDNDNEYDYGNNNHKNVRTETNHKKKRKIFTTTSITNNTLNKTTTTTRKYDDDKNGNDNGFSIRIPNGNGNKSQPPTESETTATTTVDAPNAPQELSQVEQPVKVEEISSAQATPIQISTEEAQSKPDAKKPQEEEKSAQPESEPKTSVQSAEAAEPSKSKSQSEPEVEKKVKILDIPITLGGNSTEVTEDEDEEEDERIVQEILRREAEEQHTEEEEEEEEEESLPPRPPTPPKSKQPRKSSDSSQAISNYADTVANRVVRMATETAATVLAFENSKAEKAKAKGVETAVSKPQLHNKTGGVSVVNLEETIEMENGHKMRSPTPPNVRPSSMSPIPPQQAPAVEVEKEEIPSIILQGTMPPLARQVLVSELSSSRDELRNLDSPGKGENPEELEDEEEEEEEPEPEESVSAPVVLSGKVTLSVIAGNGPDEQTDATSISQDQAQALEAEAEKTGTIKRNPEASKLIIDEDGVLDGDDGQTQYKTAELAEFVGDEREETAEDISALASDEEEEEVDEEEEEEEEEDDEEDEDEEEEGDQKR